MAELAELVAAAVALDDAAAALARAAACASGLTALVEATWTRSPATAPRAAAACAALTSGREGLPTAARAAQETAVRVRAAVRGYVTAETLAARLVRAARITGGYAVGAAGPGAWVVGGVAGALAAAGLVQRALALRLLRRTPTLPGLALTALSRWTATLDGPAGLLGWLLVGEGPVPDLTAVDARHLEQLLPFVGGVVQGALPGGPFVSTVLLGDLTGRTPVAVGTAAEAGLWLGAAHRSAGIRPGQVVVGRSLVLPPPAAHAPPRGVADLVEGIGRTYPPQPGGPGSAPAGTVEVKQLERPDGTRTWVVTIPGTQEWDPRQVRNPFDVVSNLHLMARRADDVTAAVERAMQLAGIPPGEPVVLAGHSQGGIAAAALAADPDLRGRFDIRAVVTAGSPVAHLAVPPDVATVHLEHRQDPVHALDARPNPDAPHRTTAQVDLRAAPDAALRAAAASPVAAHDVEVYARTAAALEEAGDPAWTAATAELEDLLAGAATVSTAWFTATRVPTANRP